MYNLTMHPRAKLSERLLLSMPFSDDYTLFDIFLYIEHHDLKIKKKCSYSKKCKNRPVSRQIRDIVMITELCNT